MSLKESLDSLRIAFAPFVALQTALENLERAARADDKTPLQNAFALGEAREVFAKTVDAADVIVFADINDFKNINEIYGYYAGDTAIRRVGELMQIEFVENCRAQAFHPSGDEFIVLLRRDSVASLKTAMASFDECAVLFFDAAEGEKNFTVAVSFGIAFSDDESDFQKLHSRAEMACKKAKTLGGGKYYEWDEDLERNSLETLRRNCRHCRTIIKAEVPSDKISDVKIQTCPICSSPLD
jgi:diguanylate cyclase (GGDEF)-like protein